MKRILSISILAITASLPVASFAQATNGPLTRAEVRAQTAEAERDHTLHQSKMDYPASQQYASPHQTAGATGYGTQTGGSSESRTPPAPVASSGAGAGLFTHH